MSPMAEVRTPQVGQWFGEESLADTLPAWSTSWLLDSTSWTPESTPIPVTGSIRSLGR